MLIDTHRIEQITNFYFDGFLFGMTFTEASDYVKKGFEQQGKSFVSKLNGTFCGYYIDAFTGNVVLYNDRLGMRDLFLYFYQNRIIVSDDFMDVINIVGGDDIDFTAFGEMLKLQAPLFTKTFHKNIELCPGASVIEIDIHEVQIIRKKRYWYLSPRVTEENKRKLKEEFIQIFQKSIVESFNEDDKRYCIANSGGLDSRCNLWLASQADCKFDTYTYGDKNSDAYYVASKVKKALSLRQKYIPVNTDFMKQYAGLHMQKVPMLPLNYSWYHSAYQYLADYDVNVTGFGNFFEAFTHLDSTSRYLKNRNVSHEEQCFYNYNIHSVCSDELFSKLFNKPEKMLDFGWYQAGMDSLNNTEPFNMFDEFEFEHRQRRITKNEPWMNYYGLMDVRNPMVHNEMVDFSLKLPFEYRLEKNLLMELVRDFMESVADIRLDRLPWGPNQPKGMERKLKQWFWRFDHKFYKKTGRSVWFKGAHKNVKSWLSNKPNYVFITETLNAPNELFEEYFNSEFIRNNIQYLISKNFLVLGSVLSIKLYCDRIVKRKKGSL